MANPNPKARVQRKYEAQYRDPIQVKAGESVEVGRADDDDPGWRWCRAVDCREGWVPVELLSRQEARAVMREGYSATELTVFPGDEVEVEKPATVGYWSGTPTVNAGGFPNPTYTRDRSACWLLPV
jgi:hypothetical protein